MYFGGSIGVTGVMVQAFRNSAFPYMHPWMLLFASLGLMIGTQVTDYNSSPLLKHALFTGFIGTMGMSLCPLISMAGMPIVYDALFATGFSMAGLGAIAYNAPSE